jgi:hypothetical protein
MVQVLYKLGDRKHVTLVHKQKQNLSWIAAMSWSSKQFPYSYCLQRAQSALCWHSKIICISSCTTTGQFSSSTNPQIKVKE